MITYGTLIIILPPLIIKPMRNLMPNDGPDRAIIEIIRHVLVKEESLQDAHGELHAIDGGGVEGVDTGDDAVINPQRRPSADAPRSELMESLSHHLHILLCGIYPYTAVSVFLVHRCRWILSRQMLRPHAGRLPSCRICKSTIVRSVWYAKTKL